MEKKYELVNVSTDNYILKYKDKSFEFKTESMSRNIYFIFFEKESD